MLLCAQRQRKASLALPQASSFIYRVTADRQLLGRNTWDPTVNQHFGPKFRSMPLPQKHSKQGVKEYFCFAGNVLIGFLQVVHESFARALVEKGYDACLLEPFQGYKDLWWVVTVMQ